MHSESGAKKHEHCKVAKISIVIQVINVNEHNAIWPW